MKLSAGGITTLLFTAVATAAFVWMAKRPAIDTTALSFGMPAQVTTSNSASEPEEKVEEVTAEPEKKTKEVSNEPAKEEKVEAKTEEMPVIEETEKSSEPDSTSTTTTN